MRQVMEKDAARQGVTGTGLRWVLYVSTALAAIILLGGLLFFF